jgi:regulator of protease activity HflC (stomatin/prohibitin superfamily)
MVSKAIESGDVQAINYFVAQKYIEAVKEMATTQNDKIVFMPFEASNLIGALGGIGELAKATFGKKADTES